MNLKLKAALVSTLVFPGAGQFILKKYVLGSILASLAFASFCVILINMVEHSLAIAEKIQRGEIPFDVSAISALILEHDATTSANAIVNDAWIVLVSTWLFSIIHTSLIKS